MGNVNGIINGNMAETLAELARNRKVKYDTLYRKARRKFPSEIWDAESVVRPEHIAVLFPEKRELIRRKRKAIFTTEQQPDYIQPAPAEPGAPDTPPARQGWPTFGLSEFLALAVYGHTALVWYEVAVIFALPGILAGVVLFALKHAAVVICRSEKYTDYAPDALAVAFILDGLAVWVHYTAFSDAMPDRFKDGAEFWAALILGLVVASGAFVALYFTNKTSKQ